MSTGTHQTYCPQAIVGVARLHAGSGVFAAWAPISESKPRPCAFTIDTVMNAKARWLQESSQ